MVTSLSSTVTSFVRKSAPMVALYWLLNLRFTYWFIKDVLPTPESPRMMTFSKTFLRVAIVCMCVKIDQRQYSSRLGKEGKKEQRLRGVPAIKSEKRINLNRKKKTHQKKDKTNKIKTQVSSLPSDDLLPEEPLRNR
eukprot:m.184060 g.184060  ORF g.184060 m.184060 type:complete len:137 (+) comp16661_c10_seq3:3279-3689(+)